MRIGTFYRNQEESCISGGAGCTRLDRPNQPAA